jgi:hypothetical protein
MTRPGAAEAAPVALLIAATAAAFVAAAAGCALAVLAALVVAAIAELLVNRRPAADQLLGVAGFGPVARTSVRLLAVVLIAGRIGGRSVLVATAVTAVLVVGLAGVRQAAATAVGALRRPPLLSRNLDLGDLSVPPAPGIVWGAAGLALFAEPLLAAGLALCDGDYDAWLEIGLGTATLAGLLPAAVLGMHAIRLHRGAVRHRTVEAVTAGLERLAPEVVLYFAGSPEETYQVDLWLQPVENLQRPAAVLLRDPRVLERLADTELPVVCSPYNGTLAKLPLPDRVVTLFPTHSGNNLAMLRRPEIRRVFIGHGDSDKPDSTNPFARVYDEIWVAGELGRRRYAEADIGVRDDAVVEVGRPQLVDSTGPAPVTPTVLYAPTWEGWGDDPHHSSLAHVGPAIVRRLLAEPGLRVLYRPHPLTGRRDPALRRADAEIRALLQSAGSAAPATTTGRRGDLLDDAVTTGRRRWSRTADADRSARQEQVFWSSTPATSHRVVTELPLTACFRSATLLIADVSSVVSDWLAVDRPYAIVETWRSESGDRLPSPLRNGGFVLDGDLTQLDEVIAVARGGTDSSAAARHDLRSDVIGDPATATSRFADAVSRLHDRP